MEFGARLRRVTAAVVLLAATGCGSEGSDHASSELAGSSGRAGGLAGEWVAVNRCQDLVDALRKAGLDAYIGQMLAGQYRDETAEQVAKDSEPCRGATSFRHSHAFHTDGGFASYDENGAQVDEGTYRAAGDRLTVSRPPFDVVVRYGVRGDEATFDMLIPSKCRTKRCRDAVALGIGTFFPRTYTRMK